jgi:hypothetical protein
MIKSKLKRVLSLHFDIGHSKLTAKKAALGTVGIWIERQQLGALFAGMSAKPSAVSQISHSATHPLPVIRAD